jgi:acetolactate synthase-1/2/3 large subunit
VLILIETAEAMVKCLEMENVSMVFGYPGAAICPFYDYLYKSNIKHILVRQEQNGGHAANGYARITGKPAVCIATSGPGATNLITAIATAYADSVPLVAITGQVSTDQIGRDVFQEADITGSAEPFVKHSFLVKNAQELPEIFKKAFHIAGTGRKGPVLIDVPFDVQKTPIDFCYPEKVEIMSYKPTIKGNSFQIKKVAEAVENSQRPLICAGGGVFSADACQELLEFAEMLDIPVVTTMMGIGAVRSDNRLNFGMIGMHGIPLANRAVHKCDTLILIGARVGDRAITSPSFVAENTKIIHIDIDPAEIGKNIETNIPLVGDAKYILKQLMNTIKPVKFTQWLEELDAERKTPEFKTPDNGFINPKEFISKLTDKAPENTVVVADVGQNQIWTANYFKVKGGRFLTSGGMGTMGYSVPASVGAKLANPENHVIAVCGDGSFQMQMMELGTIMQNNIPVKIIVMTNNRLGMVRELQTKSYSDRQIAVHLDGSPDFIKLAQAYSIPCARITKTEEIDDVLDKMFNAETPFFIECMVSPDESTLE